MRCSSMASACTAPQPTRWNCWLAWASTAASGGSSARRRRWQLSAPSPAQLARWSSLASGPPAARQATRSAPPHRLTPCAMEPATSLSAGRSRRLLTRPRPPSVSLRKWPRHSKAGWPRRSESARSGRCRQVRRPCAPPAPSARRGSHGRRTSPSHDRRPTACRTQPNPVPLRRLDGCVRDGSRSSTRRTPGEQDPAMPPLSASYSSGQRFAYSFLQIPPRDGHPCRSANTSPGRVGRGLSPPSECALPGAPSKGPGTRPGPLLFHLFTALPNNPLHLLFNHLGRHVPHDLVRDLAALEEQQRRNPADPVTRRRRAVLIHVDLRHLQLARIRLGHFVHCRRNHLAGPAPPSPEIHQHRLLALQHFLVEVGIRHFQHTCSSHDPPWATAPVQFTCDQLFMGCADSRKVAMGRSRPD